MDSSNINPVGEEQTSETTGPKPDEIVVQEPVEDIGIDSKKANIVASETFVGTNEPRQGLTHISHSIHRAPESEKANIIANETFVGTNEQSPSPPGTTRQGLTHIPHTIHRSHESEKANIIANETFVGTNEQPPSPPVTIRQGLTHVSHTIHRSPESPWNFFSGEVIRGPVADGSKLVPPAETKSTTEKVLENGSKGGEQSQTVSSGPTSGLVFGQIPETYRRLSGIRRDSIGKSNEKATYERPTTNTAEERVLHPVADGLGLRETFLERREREFDRREREIDRRERDLERRERELERRQREFDFDRARLNSDTRHVPQQHLQEVIEGFRKQIQSDLLAERKKGAEREVLLEEKVMKRVNEVLEHERQLYGVMKMSDNEVNEMMESSVGYLLQNDEEIADRVRFQSLLYLTQERLASEAGLQPPHGSDSFSLSWRLALGPSVVTDERYNKALELLKDKNLNDSTKKVVECKRAMEYAVEYTSHLRKEGTEMSDHSFSLGRIPRKDYMESVERHSKENPVEYEALKVLVDFICPES